jgi:hypothetical protein
MLKPECQDRHISFVANLFLQLNSLSACQNSEICAFCVHSPYHTNVSHNQYRNGCNHVIERHASVHIWRCCGDNVRFSCLGEHAGGIYFKLSDAIRIRTECSHAALLCGIGVQAAIAPMLHALMRQYQCVNSPATICG